MDGLPTVGGFMGGFLVNTCIALILYGLVTAQAYMYMLTSRGDSKAVKYLVLAIWILETVHTTMAIIIVYHYTITSFNNPLALFKIPWSVGTGFIVEIVIIFLVQSFYILRVWILSHRSILLTGFSALLLLARVGLGFGSAALLYTLGEWNAFHEQRGPKATIIGGLVFSVAMDFTIASILVYFLRKNQSATMFGSTQDILKSCMVYIVNTGALTVIASILILIMYFAERDSIFFVGFTVIAGKLYANSMLGTLNARQLLRQKSEHMKVTEGELTSMRFQVGSHQLRSYPPLTSNPDVYREHVFSSEASKTIEVDTSMQTGTFAEEHSMHSISPIAPS